VSALASTRAWAAVVLYGVAVLLFEKDVCDGKMPDSIERQQFAQAGTP